jgi:type I restriction enzyme, S subunit
MAGEGNSNPSPLPPLPTGWRVAAVEDLCEDVTSGGTPLRSNPDFFVGGRHHWFKTGELKDSVLVEAVEKLTDAALERSSAKLFPKDTVLMAMYGDGNTITSLGILATEAATKQACCAMLADRAVCEPHFLFYALRFHRHDFIRLASGGAQRNLSGKLIRRFALNVPPLPEQRAIAHILGTLDDKIELNWRMNETLEAMARALFKSWFVDFDPVRAKAEGRDPDLPKPLADLFPARLVDSELGEIPEAWEVGRFGDAAEQLRDQENPLSFPDALFHHFSIPAFDEGQTAKPEYGESIKSLKSRVPPGVILISKLNPEIERVWMVDVRPGDRAVCSTEFLVLSARPPFTRGYVYCLARSPVFRQQIEGLVTGTSKSHQRAQVESIFNLAAVMPPSSIVAAFDRSAESMLARTLECRRESRTLCAVRDTLLPKLVSGELRVKDVESFLERTGGYPAASSPGGPGKVSISRTRALRSAG